VVDAAPDDDADRRWMEEAIREAVAAGARGEIPVGAVVLLDGRLVARAGNASVAEHDPAGHAEMRALREAGRALANYRLVGATLYATVEPCVMCIGAAVHARVARLVYGCADPKAGAAGSVFDLAAEPRLNHRIAVTSGVAGTTCRALVQDFFRARR
jgi:tRNA(Arg) A34 adenosine deaminase TadA